LSKVFKSNQIILDQKKYEIKHKILHPPAVEDILVKAYAHNEDDEEHGEEHDEEVAEEIKEPEIDIEALVQERMDQAEEEIRERMADAETDREKIISDAFDKATEISEKARAEGYENGYTEGFSEGRGIAEGLIKDALDIKEQVQATKSKYVDEIEKEAVELTIETVEIILNKHIEEDYEFILGIIKKALEKCAYTASLVLRVSNEDYSMALSLKNRILALAESVDDIEIKTDNSLRQGSCVIDTSSGSIDSSIWNQFENIKETYEILLRSD